MRACLVLKKIRIPNLKLQIKLGVLKKSLLLFLPKKALNFSKDFVIVEIKNTLLKVCIKIQSFLKIYYLIVIVEDWKNLEYFFYVIVNGKNRDYYINLDYPKGLDQSWKILNFFKIFYEFIIVKKKKSKNFNILIKLNHFQQNGKKMSCRDFIENLSHTDFKYSPAL